VKAVDSPVNSVPIFNEPLPNELVVIAYEPSSPESVKYCLPDLTDFQQDIAVVEGVKFIGPFKDWSTFDQTNNCFLFDIESRSLAFYVGEFSIEFTVRDNNTVVPANKTYNLPFVIARESNYDLYANSTLLNERK
jgi:hypothetical protein